MESPHLTEAQRRAYRIADNKLTELGGWDDALLLQELQALLAEDFDLGLIGIPDDELDAFLADADDRPTISDDAADAIPAPAIYGRWASTRFAVVMPPTRRPSPD